MCEIISFISAHIPYKALYLIYANYAFITLLGQRTGACFVPSEITSQGSLYSKYHKNITSAQNIPLIFNRGDTSQANHPSFGRLPVKPKK